MDENVLKQRIKEIKEAGELMREALDDVDAHGQFANSGLRKIAERAWDSITYK